MPNCYYTCNLLPLDLVTRAGYTPRWLGNHLVDAGTNARRDALSVHPMTCPYVTKLVAAAERVLGESSDMAAGDCLVIPGGCDAARRMGDLLAATYPDRAYLLHLSRSSGPDVTETLAAGLKHLDDWLRGRQDATATDSGTPEPPALQYAKPPRPGGVFVVSGPLSNDSLLGLIDKLGGHVSGLESCTSPDRWQPLAPPDYAASGDDPDYRESATLLLEAGICPRRSTVERLAYLRRRLDEARPASIIYARQSFCDPGAYDALLLGRLAGERGLPFLEIEVDFPFDANGPLRVRVEAFLEAQLMDEDLLDSDDLFEEI